MNAEKFRLRAGFEAVHIPYKGPPEALTDIMGDRIDFVFAPVLTTLSLVRDKRVTALAVGSEKRSSVLPDLPTTQEAGYPGSAYRFWVGLLAPAGMPPALVERLNTEIREALGHARAQGTAGGGRRRCGADDGRRFQQADRARTCRECRAGEGSRPQGAVSEHDAAGEAGWHHGAIRL